MKKFVSLTLILIFIFAISFTIPVQADTLNNVTVSVDKDTIHPNEEVTVEVDFGQDLGSYTVDVAYDNNLFEYVSSEGGTENDNGTRVRLYYFDSAGGTNPRRTMSITFKAKSDIITSNPTEFSITAEGLANNDASVTYDDITIPIVKSVVVEPIYVDYDINLEYTGDIIVNEEKDMKISISSSMGKNYEHTRILAEATTPDGGSVKLFGTNNQDLEHNIIQSGWGSAEGDAIGGKDVNKELNVRGIFDKVGNYTLTFKLIDRDSSDAEIVKETFNIEVKEASSEPSEGENEISNEVVDENVNSIGNNTTGITNNEEPETLPKTGNTIYFVIIPILVVGVILYFVLTRRKN